MSDMLVTNVFGVRHGVFSDKVPTKLLQNPKIKKNENQFKEVFDVFGVFGV